MYSFQHEPSIPFMEDARELFEAHASEINLFNRSFHLDEDMYKEYDQLGACVCLTIRQRETNELIGYSVFLTHYHNHHKGKIHAHQQAVYIRPEHRGFTGITFLKYCNSKLKELGVNTVHHSVPKMNDWGKVLERIGFRELETVYIKEL